MPVPPIAFSDWDDFYRTSVGTGTPFSWRTSDGMKMWQVNLHAFKQDLYNAVDTNELVWTGYQIDATSTPNITAFYGPNTQATAHIYGGDTFITRHGWRSTIRPKFLDPTVSLTTPTPTPHDERAVYSAVVESSDNINFRHMGEKEMGKDTCHPSAPVQDLLALNNAHNLTENAGDESTSSLRYNEDYSSVSNIRTAIPFPTYEVKTDNFPTRVHRSAQEDTSSIIDNYRFFNANEYKDVAKGKGELWGITAYNNLLFFHMEKTLFKTKGKQTMQMGDGSEAYVGSGNIFAQEPEEMLQSDKGYGGTKAQFARNVTRHGYFFVDQERRKVFLMSDQLNEISAIGMRQWFKDNLPWGLEEYGMNPITVLTNFDNPFERLGFCSTWDPKYDRILLTKKDLIPSVHFKRLYANGIIIWSETAKIYDDDTTSATFGDVLEEGGGFVYATDVQETYIPIDTSTQYSGGYSYIEYANSFNDNGSVTITQPAGQPLNLFISSGWTISYFPEMSVWVSFHDWRPSMYALSNDILYSTDQGDRRLFVHHTDSPGVIPNQPGRRPAPFEFEVIHNESREENKSYFNIEYTANVVKQQEQPFDLGDTPDIFDVSGTLDLLHSQAHHPGFTSFYVWNTLQVSREREIVYMKNVRKRGQDWVISEFRDESRLETSGGLPDETIYQLDITSQTASEIGIDTNGDGILDFFPGIMDIDLATHTTLATSPQEPMFNILGMWKPLNPMYLDEQGLKTWDQNHKFMDKFMGVRLIYDNIHKNFITLLSTKVGMRKYLR